MNLDRMGSPGERVCKPPCGLRRAFCSQSARRRSRTGRAHVFACGTPQNARFALNAQGDVMAARMVGIRQEGIKSLPDGTVRKGTRSANTCHDVTKKGGGCELPRWCAGCELLRWWCGKGKKKASLASGKQDSQARGERPPCLGTGYH